VAGRRAHAHGPRLLQAVRRACGAAPAAGRVAYTLQTNGTKIDDEWASFLAAHKFLIGLSVDGRRHLHDRYRVDKGGQGSFDRVTSELSSRGSRRLRIS